MRTLTFNRVIGNGAMGTVYHAEFRVPRGFARQCAVKVMKATSPDQEHFRARMRDEARLLGMLQDEQILGVSELVRVEGRDCVVMEYVEGADLAEVIKVESVPPRALAELGAEVAGTVHRAHMAIHPQTGEPLRVIHRDVKPANIMVTSRGGVRLLDFGVARAAFASRESQTQGLVLGTLNYFPPEILAGGEPTPAVDIYGLGLTLWECATGKDWGSPQVHRHRFERRVEQRLGEVDEKYDPIVGVLREVLHWDPSRRPDGARVEKALLEAAEKCAGGGLRRWARDTVPPILQERMAQADRDDLVGRTIALDGGESSDREDTEEPQAPPPAMTFNDLAPPAAVKRLPPLEPDPEVAQDQVPTKRIDRSDLDRMVASEQPTAARERPKRERPARTPAKKKRKRASKGPNTLLVLLAAVGLGGIVGVMLVVALVVIVAIARIGFM